VAARDKAILAAVKMRRWSSTGLSTVLPNEPGQTVEQRQVALSSALIRLRVKQQIRQTSDGEWELA
jgi:hypothetical protein